MATNIELKNAKPKEKNYTINVDARLSLLIKATGGKLWRFRYSFLAKRCMISLGKYPQISMSQAKAKQREYMDILDKGINPSSHKQTQKIKLATKKSFTEVALDWHTKHYKDSRDRFNTLILRRLEIYLFPVIGRILLKDIEVPMLFNLIESIQDLGYLEAGKYVNSYCLVIFYAP